MKGVDLTDNGLALEAMLTNGPGQHFLGAEHTLANFETAFWSSRFADNNSFEQWEMEGAADSVTRAGRVVKRMLAEYEAPEFDEAKDAELREWIDRRRASFPDSDV
jgi:trimethylamine---corrinoid protein Co-methyltransferase